MRSSSSPLKKKNGKLRQKLNHGNSESELKILEVKRTVKVLDLTNNEKERGRKLQEE